MARRSNLYEIALEHALRMRGVPLLAVNETSKAEAQGRSFKNFDYLIYREDSAHWLCEVKGRRLNASRRGDAWIPSSDLTCLEGWRGVFGEDYEPVFAFVFDATGIEGAEAHHHAFDHDWQFWLVAHRDYQRLARRRSEKWKTLALRASAFDGIAKPLLEAFPRAYAEEAPDPLAAAYI